MGIPKPPYTGQCLCGAVRVNITAPPLLTVACHCADCQKLTASAFSLTTMFPRDSFECTGALVTGGRHSAERRHFYCRSCLCFVYSEVGQADRINLRTSVLDEADKFEPFLEVMREDKLEWTNTPSVHRYDRYPTSPEELQALMSAYSTWFTTGG
ncbi:MAG: GFA family protein [Pseudomonadota bacterium]